ncbi:flavin reductase family protein [Mycobacterium sp. CVI_P3]|uniref:Flavin reductase family protein n=1 Tax=Mycobacterium pinniadriaticum TaxID=2994102 RepID=A0ABT3SAT2_9MYCO|nr:flavin reductase family protein [Mycobacterium pinniadriaticum]MCX2929601.1 flavin reductase family protein [Mycobacterium pinniadriaticum]MCX2936025.1 flavin reductase family protein [Mycobacterium pinniadriaticum]
MIINGGGSVAEHQVAVGPEAFEQIVGLLDYPMSVVTTKVGDERAGCLVGFSTQVSIKPPRYLVGLSKLNHTYEVAGRGATHLAVHLLAKERQELARLFGGDTGDRIDKFSRCRWWNGPEGLPILSDAAAWFAGHILGRFDLGDHVGHLIEPVAGVAPERLGDLVTSSDVKDLEPGHEA